MHIIPEDVTTYIIMVTDMNIMTNTLIHIKALSDISRVSYITLCVCVCVHIQVSSSLENSYLSRTY